MKITSTMPVTPTNITRSVSVMVRLRVRNCCPGESCSQVKPRPSVCIVHVPSSGASSRTAVGNSSPPADSRGVDLGRLQARFQQDLATVLAKSRRQPVGSSAGESENRTGMSGITISPSVGCDSCAEEADRVEMRIIHEPIERMHRSGRNLAIVEQRQPFLGRRLASSSPANR